MRLKRRMLSLLALLDQIVPSNSSVIVLILEILFMSEGSPRAFKKIKTPSNLHNLISFWSSRKIAYFFECRDLFVLRLVLRISVRFYINAAKLILNEWGGGGERMY